MTKQSEEDEKNYLRKENYIADDSFSEKKNPISNRHYYYSNCGSSIWWHFIVLYSNLKVYL